MNTVPIPSHLDLQSYGAGDIEAYLQHMGYEVASVTITRTAILVELIGDGSGDDTNLAADIEGFQPTPTAKELAKQQLLDLDLETATMTELKESVALIRELVT